MAYSVCHADIRALEVSNSSSSKNVWASFAIIKVILIYDYVKHLEEYDT